ncbi:hypothetical protein EW146_g2652 [Bondarzewia mesenterica]|uniref:coproporphyrinogen oxidase n=1 Tax=Bondarzewia mesenterica TaxID=1095465 RepID=A0A4V3XFP5_9AGAM|nr:hypothetical protein EW146_g2652 [Bondarzewia mesenterica]
MRQQVTGYITRLQDSIVAALEGIDDRAPPFRCQSWERAEGGGGRSCTFGCAQVDSVLEKAGVNISTIHGTLSPPAIRQMSTEHASLPSDPPNDSKLPFFAGGISIILHPRNPNAPSVHANYRYMEVTASPDSEEIVAWWFGGVTDLTPAYLFEEDAEHFHTVLKRACDAHGPALYHAFKKSCDDYFYIPHRGEHRGIGGIRFDNLSNEPHPLLLDGTSRPRTPAEIFAFVQTLGDAFLSSYLPILERRMEMPYDDRMRRWQLLRRGRGIEFTLVYERGTKFGLAAPGVNVENVLVSMPEEARWEYMSELGREQDDSEESRLTEVLKKPQEWA